MVQYVEYKLYSKDRLQQYEYTHQHMMEYR